MNTQSFVKESADLKAYLDKNILPKDYPKGMRQIESAEFIKGTAFFPGGDGIYKENNSEDKFKFPYNGIMVLGQDWGDTTDLKKAINRKNESSAPTWYYLKKWFDSAGIKMNDCFFTNAIMGIRIHEKGTKKKNTGPFLETIDEPFKDKCFDFLLEQVRFQQPKLIICLGKEVFKFLNYYIPELEWKGNLAINKLNESKLLFQKGIKFGKDSEFSTNFAALIHPSYGHINENNFIYNQLKGTDSITVFLQDIAKQSGIYVSKSHP